MTWVRVEDPSESVVAESAVDTSEHRTAEQQRVTDYWSGFMKPVGLVGHIVQAQPWDVPTEPLEAAPTSDVYVVAVDELYLYFDDVGVLVRQGESLGLSWTPTSADVSWIVTVLRRWPSLGQVKVADAGVTSRLIVTALTGVGIDAELVKVPFRVSVSRRSRWGAQWVSPFGWVNGRVGFGSDLPALVAWAQQLKPDVIPVDAAEPYLSEVGRLFDAAGLHWRQDGNQLAEVISSGDMCADGLSLRLDLERYGWMSVVAECGGQRFEHLATNVLNQGWDELVRAVRVAAVDGRACFFGLDAEGTDLRGIIVPQPQTGLATVHWQLPGFRQGRAGGRPSEPLGTWRGPMHALAKVTAKASRAILTTAGEDAVQDRWGDPPTADLIALERYLS